MTTLYIKTHNITGLKYFGKTVKEDSHRYKGSGTYWTNHVKKHGYDVTTDIYAQFDETDYIERILLEGCALMFSTENDIVNSKEWANMKPENGLDSNLGLKLSAYSKNKMKEQKQKLGSDGLTTGQRGSLKTSETMRTRIDSSSGLTLNELRSEKTREGNLKIGENGLNGYERGSLKMVETRSIINENGLTSYQIGGIKTAEKLKDPMNINNVLGSKRYNNGEEEILIKDGELIPDGFIRGRIQTVCPFCKKLGDIANMKKYHFEKCKLKDNYEITTRDNC